MRYYHAKTVELSFEEAIRRITEELDKEGFGILTEIDVRETLKKKLDVDVEPYTILGACNPGFAHEAIQAENKIGTVLPCNVIVREAGDGTTEIAAVDPIASMQAVDNEALRPIAAKARKRLREAAERIE